MGALKLSYYEQGRDLEVNPIFLLSAVEKNASKKIFRLSSYRYGFNGMEKDDEIDGVTGSKLDFGARIYDSRLGRWLARDPLAAKFPNISPYAFVANMPIIAIDPDGRDIYFVNRGVNSTKPEITKENFKKIINVMNSTEKGHQMVQEYINNPDKDLYIQIGETGGAMGHALDYVDPSTGKNVPVPTTKFGASDYVSMGGFQGVKVDASKVNKFIVINQDEKNIGTESLEDVDLPYLKIQAKVLGHEIGSHTEGKSNNTEQQDHNDWGQDHYSHSQEVGTGKAKEFNTQVNKLRPKDVKKNNLKMKSTSQQGVSKVIK